MPKRKYEMRPQCRTCPYVEKRDEYEWFCNKDDLGETIFLGRYRRRPNWCPVAREREEKRMGGDSGEEGHMNLKEARSKVVAKTSSMVVSEAQLNAPKGFILINGMYFNVDRILCFDGEDIFLVHDSVIHHGMSVAELTLLINNARKG